MLLTMPTEKGEPTMTCKDCIHDRVCVAVKAMGEEQRYAEHCKSFKNKADYAEVKHGKWIQGVPYVCSICGKPAPDEKNTSERYSCWTSPYCPHCGAKMDVTEAGVKHARWKYWDGWCSNHDQRIEDAVCSNCGYEHQTIRLEKGEEWGSVPNKLAKECPKCHAKMDL